MKYQKLIAFLLFSLLLVIGCKLSENLVPDPTRTSEHNISSPTRTPEQAIPAPSHTPSSEATIAQSLSQDGPWWVFHTTMTLWVVNADGSRITPVVVPDSLNTEPRTYRLSPSPTGGWLAFIETEPGNSPAPPELKLAHLPDLQVVSVAQLHPNIPVDREDVDAYDRLLATGVANTLAWSPDGTRLAFNAVIDGQSGDLYVYDIATHSLTRLTNGPTETVFPVWSPDSQRIVHGGVWQLNLQKSGAGYNYASVWSAEADASNVTLLFKTQIVGFERVVGWLNNSVVLMDTETPNENPFCPYSNLRSINLDNQEIQVILSGRYAARAFDPENKTVLLSTTGDSGCEQQLSPGSYFLNLMSAQPPLPVVEDVAIEIEWSEAVGLFFADVSSGVLAVSASGQLIDLVRPEGTYGLPLAVSGSQRLAWEGKSLWIGSLQNNIDYPPQKIYDGKVYGNISWSPDGQCLLFMDGTGLYAACEPDFEPQWMADGGGDSPVWVLPSDR